MKQKRTLGFKNKRYPYKSSRQLSCMLSTGLASSIAVNTLSILNVGIPLYDPFSIQDQPQRKATFRNRSTVPHQLTRELSKVIVHNKSLLKIGDLNMSSSKSKLDVSRTRKRITNVHKSPYAVGLTEQVLHDMARQTRKRRTKSSCRRLVERSSSNSRLRALTPSKGL